MITRLSPCTAVVDLIRHLLTYGGQFKELVLDEGVFSTGERAPQLLRQSKPRNGEDLIDAFQDRAGDPGPVSFELSKKRRSLVTRKPGSSTPRLPPLVTD